MAVGGSRSQARLIAADFVAWACLAFCAALAVSLVLAGAVLLLSGSASAATGEAPTVTQPAQSGQGSLLFRKGGAGAAPLLRTEVLIRVSGMVARAQVRQTFRNPFEDWYEGLYVFPLPKNAAVDHLKMRIGDREVEGVIREREAAKKDYEQARQSGRRATLLEQERPNIFTASVANIGPRENIVVEIEYQQTLRFDAGAYSLRFPMVVGPRYIPGTVPAASSGGSGWAQDTDRVADASRITPPVLHPSAGAANPVSLKVELDAGMPIAEVTSPYHRIKLKQEGDRRQIVELADGTVSANRDFELNWKPAREAAPRLAWFTEKKGDRSYGLLMVVPPDAPPAGARLAREVIYVIDTSGSMHGASIAQAKGALDLAIARLAPGDSFDVIEFNSNARSLFHGAQPASEANRGVAREWVRVLDAQGGTEMGLALRLALDGREHPDRIRQVIFLTDGAVGNEDELFRLITGRLGDSRLFTVGIGSAPNSHFMTKAARLGGGTFTYIGRIEEVGAKMSALFAKLESPLLKGLAIEWPAAAKVESWPKHLPDLYQGEPVVVMAAMDRAEGKARISAKGGDLPWETEVALDQPSRGSGMGQLFAREKIAALIDSLREGAGEAEVRARVVDVALAHHLVTRYTSLVAVDRTPARPTDALLKTAALPTNLPDGWSYEHVFGMQEGELPQGATDSRFNLLAGMLALALAAFAWMQPGRRRAKVWP